LGGELTNIDSFRIYAFAGMTFLEVSLIIVPIFIAGEKVFQIPAIELF
jgi:hypothetical protein